MKKEIEPIVSAKEFIKAYLESTSYVEIMEKTGLKKMSCYMRAYHLRLAGVELPKFYKNIGQPKSINAEKLNKIIDSYKKVYQPKEDNEIQQ